VSGAREFIHERKTAYQLTFNINQPSDVDVLIDLARFCRANESTLATSKDGRVDTERMLVLNGRREVWLRIQQHLGLTPEQLLALYTGNAVTRRIE